MSEPILKNGVWHVGNQPFKTNAAAWRYIDREENEPVSRQEDVGDWAFNKAANGE